jgi:4'-phosphopantetheinyl transferase
VCVSPADVPLLSPGSCQVWWASRLAVRHWHSRLLSVAELNRRQRYRRHGDRDRFTVGATMARLVLSSHTGTTPERIVIDRSCSRCGCPHGRPRLVADNRFDFSVSHSGDAIGLAIVRVADVRTSADSVPASREDNTSARGIGLDVEQLTELRMSSLPEMVLSTAELGEYGRLDDSAKAAAFFRYWVRKEAVLKATGDGLAVPPSRLTVSAPYDEPRLHAWTGRPLMPRAIALSDLAPPYGHVASLAVIGVCRSVEEFDAAELLSSE